LAYCCPRWRPTQPNPQARQGLGLHENAGLYNLCTSSRSAELGQCEGFITGVAAMMQNDQLAKVKVCVPEARNSQQVTDRVVAYLRATSRRRHAGARCHHHGSGAGHPLQLHAGQDAAVLTGPGIRGPGGFQMQHPSMLHG
jgi:hypothetical protein